MTSFPVVVNINDSLEVASKLMAEYSIRHLPVVSEGKPVSVVSDREIKAALGLSSTGYNIKVGDVCAIEGYMVDEKTPLVEVVKNMHEHKIGSVLVTTNNRIAGIFTAVDVCKYFCLLLEQE